LFLVPENNDNPKVHPSWLSPAWLVPATPKTDDATLLFEKVSMWFPLCVGTGDSAKKKNFKVEVPTLVANPKFIGKAVELVRPLSEEEAALRDAQASGGVKAVFRGVAKRAFS
jgi:hypothetical protein